MEMDLSDEVSALSMDGASAIAGKAHLKRLRKDFAKMQMGIPEDEEQQQHHHQQTQEHHPHHRPLSSEEQLNNKTNGDELIEPFPKTYEEWKEKKKEKKHKHKSKKHLKKSSSKSKSGHSRSSSKHKSKSGSEHQQQLPDQLENAGQKAAPPIMEISIQSTNFGDNNTTPASPTRRSSSQHETSSDVRSYDPSIASTEDTSQSQQQQRNNFNSSFTGSGAMGMALRRSQQHQHQHRSSLRSSIHDHSSLLREARSTDDGESQTHMTGHSTHMTNQSSCHSHGTSHVTIEDITTLKTKLERARMEERQVLEIHERLKGEVVSAELKAQRAREFASSVTTKLDEASAERTRLQQLLANMQNENKKLHDKLRKLEDVEDEQGLDDMLDSMESKIKALKLKSKRSKERRASLKD